MKKFVIVFLFLSFATMIYSQKEWITYSPNHSLAIKLSNNEGKLSYQVLSGEEMIIQSSSLGIETEGNNFSTGLSFVKGASKKINENYTLTIVKRRENH